MINILIWKVFGLKEFNESLTLEQVKKINEMKNTTTFEVDQSVMSKLKFKPRVGQQFLGTIEEYGDEISTCSVAQFYGSSIESQTFRYHTKYLRPTINTRIWRLLKLKYSKKG